MLKQTSRLFAKVERPIFLFDQAGWRALPTPRQTLDAPVRRAPAASAPPDPSGICVVVPCYNVAGLCEEVIREAVKYCGRVIVVDDGSTDGTRDVLSRVAAENGGRVELLAFARNRGKGAAILDAFRRALQTCSFRLLVTLDGDRQHSPSDIPALVRRGLDEDADLVVGERGEFQAMPLRSRVGNSFTGLLLRLIYPTCPCDTQSGMRAHHRRFVEEIVRRVQGSRYEVELQILLLALAQHRRVRTVPIPTIYHDGNRLSHFRPIRDSLRIYRAIVRSLVQQW